MMRMLNARCEVLGLVASSYHVTTPASDLIYQLTHVQAPVTGASSQLLPVHGPYSSIL